MSASSQSFLRYSALVSATFAGAATASATSSITVFDAPYATGLLTSSFGNYITESVSTTGAWTSTVDTTGANRLNANGPDSLTLTLGYGQYDFTTTIVTGFDTISFAYSTQENDSGDTFGYTVNGAFNAVTGGGTVSNLALSAGDIFGFRVLAAAYSSSSTTLTISNLTASASAVPEPASAASWLGLGVAGVVAMREMRRRPRAAAQA